MLSGRIVDLVDGCIELGTTVRRIGDESAANYIDGAGMSLRIAGRALAAHLPSNILLEGDLTRALEMRVGAPGLTTTITPARRTGPDLGVCLLKCTGTCASFGDPLGSALLEDALWRWAWLHVDARTTWQTTREGARALVAVLNDARPPVEIGNGMAGRVDGEVVRVLAGLGWMIHPDQL